MVPAVVFGSRPEYQPTRWPRGAISRTVRIDAQILDRGGVPGGVAPEQIAAVVLCQPQLEVGVPNEVAG
jgi:hypothetical protein